MLVFEDSKTRWVLSKSYNSYFNKEDGLFARWGKTIDDDPIKAPLPEIADIEISSGRCHNSCKFCYKSNSITNELHNMSFAEFQNIFHKLAKTTVRTVMKSGEIYEEPFDYWFGHYDTNIETDAWRNSITCKQDIIDRAMEISSESLSLTEKFEVYNKGLLSQIAFGITSPNDNRDFFRMMEYARAFDVIPNYTCNGADMTEEIADKTVKICGAIAISCCTNKEASYNAIKMLTDRGMKQVNIHYVAMDSTFNDIMKLLDDTQTDARLKWLNAIVLLKYKPKGTNAGMFKPLTQEQYNQIFNKANELGVGIGFDSCSCHSFLETIKDKENYKELAALSEPCESTLFSVYINSYGEVFPCSFSENECRNKLDWRKGLNLLYAENLEDVWNSDRFNEFRDVLLTNERRCPIFSLEEV